MLCRTDIKHAFQEKKSHPFLCQNTARTETLCKGIWRVKYLFLLKCVAKAFEATVARKEWRWSFFFFYWELLKLKIPIYSHFPLEVYWGWLIPLLWYANGQLAFLQGTLDGVQGTQRRCPVRRAARPPRTDLGQHREPSLCFGLKIKIPLLIVFPSNTNVYIFTLLVISAGQ